MSLLTPTSALAQNNDHAVNEAVIDLRSLVQRCLEQRGYHGQVVVQIDITNSRITHHEVTTNKKTKHT